MALWPDHDEHQEDIEDYFALQKPNYGVMVAETEAGLCGFIEVGTRAYAEGCSTSPVAYIEGWYVDPKYQRQGLGRLLVEAAESWARGQGFTEIASDTWLENHASIQAHQALGYEEVERLVCFAKRL